MSIHSIAWECALSLLQDYPERLTIHQAVVCHVAAMAGPDDAPLGVIAIAAQVVGART